MKWAQRQSSSPVQICPPSRGTSTWWPLAAKGKVTYMLSRTKTSLPQIQSFSIKIVLTGFSSFQWIQMGQWPGRKSAWTSPKWMLCLWELETCLLLCCWPGLTITPKTWRSEPQGSLRKDMGSNCSAVTHLDLCLPQAACEKTVSVMHHVIKRTITYANGMHWNSLLDD